MPSLVMLVVIFGVVVEVAGVVLRRAVRAVEPRLRVIVAGVEFLQAEGGEYRPLEEGEGHL